MDFASKHVLMYDSSDEEIVSDEELKHGMTLSDSDSDEDAATLPPTLPPTVSVQCSTSAGGIFSSIRRKLSKTSNTGSKPAPKHKSHWRMGETEATRPTVKGKAARRADTNVICVKFDCLKTPSHMHSGDCFRCSCGVAFSAVSQLNQIEGKQIWRCEFCGVQNESDLVPEECPTERDVTYMIKPAPVTEAAGRSGTDDSLVVFCVDISGSMCVTTEVQGRIQLRGTQRLDSLRSFNDDHSDQYLPNQRRNVTYISRLQGMQAAVDHQLEVMAKEHPERRVALIAFNKEVTVIGDGTSEVKTIAGDKLSSQEELEQLCPALVSPQAIRISKQTLSDRVYDLEEGGATALGPALLLSVHLAGRARGSKVIICTDGMANVGLGSLEKENSGAFYEELGQLAKNKGVSVSVTTIEGTEAKVRELGEVADATGGVVNRVDPIKLTQVYGSIIANPVIATNVKATLILHKRLYIRNHEDLEEKDNKVDRDVGNVTAKTELTFEYGVMKVSSAAKDENMDTGETSVPQPQPERARIDDDTVASVSAEASAKSAVAAAADEPTKLPFQLQIQYTDLDGAEALRVITDVRDVTRDRDEAEKTMDLAVLGVNTAHVAGQLAINGMYTDARSNAMMQQRQVQRAKKKKITSADGYAKWYSNIAPMEMKMNQQQQKERSTRGRSYSDEEDDDDDFDNLEDRPAQYVNRIPPPPAAGGPLPPPTRSLAKGGKGGGKGGKRYKARREECDDDAAEAYYGGKNVSKSAFM